MSKRIILNLSQLNEVMSYDSKNLKKVQNKIYRTVADYCGKMHSDSAWQDVSVLIKMIKSVDFVDDVFIGSGEYFNYTSPENGAYRDYKTTVVTTFGNLYGYIRCNAAGTMDDIFKYYDMTISLYPDKKRDLEDSLNEDIDVAVDAKTNSQSEYLSALKSPGTQNDIMKAKAVSPDVNASINGPKTTDDSPKLDIDVPQGSTPDQVMIQQPEISGAIANGASVRIHGDGFPNESKTYTKKQVEQMRLYEMRKSGTVLSKKQLNDEFLLK